MKPISVVIITYNEEHNIRRCLESIKSLADEIVIVDSLSTDGTKSICLEYGARFIEQKFLGYIEQKNFALSLANNDYILSLDADEALSSELLSSIVKVKEAGFPYDGYTMNRCTSFCGKWIKHGTWYPDRKLRVFNRKKAAWGGVNPHDKIEIEPGSTTIRLQGDILHYSFYKIGELIAQTNKFTTIQAKAMYENGKRSSFIKLTLNPLFAFISGFILKGGFLDGKDGFIVASSVAYQTFLKYAKLLHLQKDK